MAMDQSYSEEGKTSTGLEAAGNQKKRKTKANVEKCHSGRSRKMQ
jgi:hypothetical protein